MTLSEEHENLLRLSAVPGIGGSKLRALVAYFKSAAKIFQASPKRLTMVTGIDVKTAHNIKKFNGQRFAAQQFSRMEKSGARLITFWDKEYPPRLKQIYDPPALLFVKGELTTEDKYAVAIVGTRRPTNYGKIVTEKLTVELARMGLTIVSGLAYGVDTLAHSHCLHAGGRTVAVLGSGVDVIYPNENRRLADQVSSNGALVSEFPLGAGPDRMNFPKRNRIICGMSLGVLVIEAGEKSGALITAMMALEQNREVFAVPGNIDSPRSIGTNKLLKQGAKLVTSVDDVIEELAPQLAPILKKDELVASDFDLSDDEKRVIDFLTHEPKHIDFLAKECKQNTSIILSTLLSLELKNRVRQLPGKLFIKI